MDFKKHFDIPEDIIYLNTPGNGLLPRKHHQWRSNRDKDFFEPNGMLREQQPQFIQEVKVTIGDLFGCPITQTYAIPNFSFGFNTLLTGLNPKTKFAIIEDDYPSLNYPILSRGFDYVKINGDAFIEQNILNAIAQHKPDVLLLSIINYINGLKIDFHFIAKLKKDNPNLLIIADATQWLGTEPFDFATSGFDAIGASGYKWMMAGFGNGLLMLSKQIQSALFETAQKGERPKETMWSNKSILDTFFEPGHQDTLAHGTLMQSILFLKSVGLQNIQAHIQDITDYTYQKLENRNLLLPLSKDRPNKSPLINIQLSPDLYPQMLEEGVKCFPRGTGIRIGLHLYNNTSDVDRLINIIDKYI